MIRKLFSGITKRKCMSKQKNNHVHLATESAIGKMLLQMNQERAIQLADEYHQQQLEKNRLNQSAIFVLPTELFPISTFMDKTITFRGVHAVVENDNSNKRISLGQAQLNSLKRDHASVMERGNKLANSTMEYMSRFISPNQHLTNEDICQMNMILNFKPVKILLLSMIKNLGRNEMYIVFDTSNIVTVRFRTKGPPNISNALTVLKILNNFSSSSSSSSYTATTTTNPQEEDNIQVIVNDWLTQRVFVQIDYETNSKLNENSWHIYNEKQERLQKEIEWRKSVTAYNTSNISRGFVHSFGHMKSSEDGLGIFNKEEEEEEEEKRNATYDDREKCGPGSDYYTTSFVFVLPDEATSSSCTHDNSDYLHNQLLNKFLSF